MSLYKQSELFAFLNSIGRKPNKRLSQNFLIDGNILNKIVDAASLSPGDLVIEIGPGPGALTEALIAKEIDVIAIEKDRLFAEKLGRLDKDNRLSIIQEDVLEVDFLPLLKNRKAKIISNLPYHLTSPIMGKILPLYGKIETIVVMLQKEVAVRMSSPPGSKNYGSFSIFTQFYSDTKYLFSVSPNCFFPRPKVTSGVIRCTPKKTTSSFDKEAFFTFIKSVFSKRRKMLLTILKEEIDKEALTTELQKLGYSEKCRPEEIAIHDFVHIYKSFY
ncbi:ribosomal RNA small subunit methyltransferase A [Candidatus Aerophobetes bacterium]|uniref:Ribosomal RNA small subunit methyltransferase A n=1 Tax=Aerophobetes bacterium TaxID=2030807 RepID=A0A2A4YMH8_UNCAE|nr:MAG: ribosomal RNA small subunit methyltransferase A [Candidatus Aerophobetes bacterium]